MHDWTLVDLKDTDIMLRIHYAAYQHSEATIHYRFQTDSARYRAQHPSWHESFDGKSAALCRGVEPVGIRRHHGSGQTIRSAPMNRSMPDTWLPNMLGRQRHLRLPSPLRLI
jgi:hypothetical protein